MFSRVIKPQLGILVLSTNKRKKKMGLMGLMGLHNPEHDFCGISNARSAVSKQLGGLRVL